MRDDILLMVYDKEDDRYDIIFNNHSVITTNPYSMTYVTSSDTYTLNDNRVVLFCLDIISRKKHFKKIADENKVFYYTDDVDRYSIVPHGYTLYGKQYVSLCLDGERLWFRSTHPIIVYDINELRNTIAARKRKENE